MKHLVMILIAVSSVSALADLTPSCKKVVYAAVLKKALRVNNTAQVEGHKVVYGDDPYNPAFSDTVIVLVSDETEPSHYIVVTKKKAKTCTILFNDVSADGSLPPVDGLNE